MTDLVEISKVFNRHFGSAGKHVQMLIKNSDNVIKKNHVKKINCKLNFEHILESYICRIVQNLKSKSSTGYDGISNLLLKELIKVVKSPLCILVNRSLAEGIFPDMMKIAKIIPLHKGGDSQITDNYRPISLLPVISKVLERVVYDQTVQYLSDNDIVYSRKHHSTSDAVMNLVGEALRAFESDQMVLSIFVDLRKAFDSVSHQVVLEKLKLLGILGTEFKWFTSYLTDRRQYVEINNAVSGYCAVETGVP